MNPKILAVSFATITALMALADNSSVLVYNKSKVDVFFSEEIDSIRFTEAASPHIQEIWTPDSVYSYNVNDIDSIVFKPNSVVPKASALNLANEIYPYVLGSDFSDGLLLKLSKSTPQNLLPKMDSGVYCLSSCEKLPAGFAGVVKSISEVGETILLTCKDADLDELFEQLIWTSQSYEAGSAEKPRCVSMGTFAATPEYPDYIDGVIKMTDELRDIPAGPENAIIKSKITVSPSIIYNAGAYVIPLPNGETSKLRRVRTHINSKVSGEINGRYNVGEKKHTSGSNEKITKTVNLGLGLSYTLTFTGTLSTKGKMGLDYSFNDAEYCSSVVTTIEYDNNGWARGKSNIKHKCLSAPKRSLDVSLSGEAALTASLTLTTTQSGDSLKSISSIFTYGSKLEGDALFLTSELDSAAKDNTLYKRLTATGITASSTEKVSASAKYQSANLKMTDSIEVSPSEIFYVVPKFSKPIYESRTLTYKVSGTPMNFSLATLGIATNRNGSFSFSDSDNVWPKDCRQEFSASVSYDPASGYELYPTVTMPTGERILAAPKYPYVGNILFPIISTQTMGGVTVTSGTPIIGSASNGTTSLNIGNLFPFKVKDQNKK